MVVLKYNDLEEYIEEDWKGRDVHEKTDPDAMKIRQRKEMKKAKAILIRGMKILSKILVKDKPTLYTGLSKLLEKYAVKIVWEDFNSLDYEWSQFKVIDLSTDPDLIFKTLEEQLRHMIIFREQYTKDDLQVLSKLKYALPKEYDNIFMYLNTNKEQNKSYK